MDRTQVIGRSASPGAVVRLALDSQWHDYCWWLFQRWPVCVTWILDEYPS